MKLVKMIMKIIGWTGILCIFLHIGYSTATREYRNELVEEIKNSRLSENLRDGAIDSATYSMVVAAAILGQTMDVEDKAALEGIPSEYVGYSLLADSQDLTGELYVDLETIIKALVVLGKFEVITLVFSFLGLFEVADIIIKKIEKKTL